MTTCPSCATPWRVGHAGHAGNAQCECGYNSEEVANLLRERGVWRRWRNVSFATWVVGFVVLMVVPGISLGLAAAVGGLLTSAGFVVGVLATFNSRAASRRLRAAQTPKQLPEARLL